MKFEILRLLFIILIINLWLSFQNQVQSKAKILCQNFAKSDKYVFFKENKGQILEGTNIKYYLQSGNACLYFRPNKISFVFTNPENDPPEISEATGRVANTVIEGMRHIKHQLNQPVKTIFKQVDMLLLHCNPDVEIIASDIQEYYENFYLPGSFGRISSGITHVHNCKTLTYKNIYHNIDLVFHNCKEGVEYDFVVFPGGKVTDIKIAWNGVLHTKESEDGGICHYFTEGMVKEGKPHSFQEIGVVQSLYLKYHNYFGFKVGAYNPNKKLVIDPTISWATYLGYIINYQSSNAYMPKISVDHKGNIFIGETIETLTGLVSSGAYDTKYSGNGDACVIKLNPDGSRAWATYFGGTGNESVTGATCDTNGNIIITGGTNSTGIATSGAYITSLAGSDGDGFIAKFSSAGSLVWAHQRIGNCRSISRRIRCPYIGISIRGT